MVDVSEKKPTVRIAETQCLVSLNQEAYDKLKARQLEKGDALTMAEI
jgi:cyclic pyranopterin monophosphate synthase